ncbi:transposase, partial [Piscinibacterium candidicorallinum]
TYGRTGTLFEGRYRATVVDSERYLLTCMRYIEDNPVRAAMVAQPADYPWSSHGANASGARGENADWARPMPCTTRWALMHRPASALTGRYGSAIWTTRR